MSQSKNNSSDSSSTRPGRVPPHSLDAEKALLGSVMLRPDAVYEIGDLLKTEDFYSHRHSIIFETMRELATRNTPIDLLSLSTRLEEKQMLEQAGGSSYLTELVDTVPSAANITYYGQLVHKKALLRGLIRASEFISQLGFTEDEDIEEVLDKAEKKIYEITTDSQTHKFVELGEILGEAWERLDHLHKSDDHLRGVPSGFNALDNKLSGFQKSDLVILAARPSVGKTALALDIARQSAVEHQIPVGIFSLEMSAQQLVDRMLAAQARIDSWKLRTGKISTEEEFDKIRDALDQLNGAPLFIDDTPGNNILKMRSVARRLKSERGLGMLIIDYMQLMVPTVSRASDSMVQQVTEISRSLKELARELDIPVIALSQLSRAIEQRGGRPRLSDLRDSGSIEQDADVVMFIHRQTDDNEEAGRSHLTELVIEKHRNGPTGVVELSFDKNKSSFISVEKSDFSRLEEEFSNLGTEE